MSRDSSSSPVPRPRSRGFTLVEMAVVLVVIGLILGAVAIGRDLQRNAVYQRLGSDFVQSWQVAYDAYVAATGMPPGDNPLAPTGQVNGSNSVAGVSPELCGSALLNLFQAAGVALPPGRTEGQSDRYVYLDSNGNPQEAQVCFANVSWADPGASTGTYVIRPRNVMAIKRWPICSTPRSTARRMRALAMSGRRHRQDSHLRPLHKSGAWMSAWLTAAASRPAWTSRRWRWSMPICS